MIDDLNKAIEAYHQKWHKLVDGRTNKLFFCDYQPTAVGWKTADRAEYDRLFAELHDLCDIIVDVYMDGRWIAKMHLKEPLDSGIQIVKLMQRRPNSTDAVGLDHIDWYSPRTFTDGEAILKKEPDLKWTNEENGAKWISIWFDGTEAKLRDDTVIDSCIRELKVAKQQVLG